jgi:hypothetical protein
MRFLLILSRNPVVGLLGRLTCQLNPLIDLFVTLQLRSSRELAGLGAAAGFSFD